MMDDDAPLTLPPSVLVPERLRRTPQAPDRVLAIFRDIGSASAVPPQRLLRVPDRPDLLVTLRVQARFPLDHVWRREVRAAVLLAGRPVAALIFHEYEVPRGLSDHAFFECMDEWSSASAEVGEAVLANWSIRTLGRGSTRPVRIISFDTLWAEPAAAAAASWVPAAEVLIAGRYRGKSDLMLLKPFPLEYEGAGKAVGNGETAFLRRRAAMIRLYRRALSAELMHAPDSAEAWMYRPMRRNFPQPPRQPRQIPFL
jgi:hypothetical protein